MKEYDDTTEPEHVLSDAMAIIGQFKEAPDLVVMYRVVDDNNKATYGRHYKGDVASLIGLIEMTKIAIIDDEGID